MTQETGLNVKCGIYYEGLFVKALKTTNELFRVSS